MADVKLIDMTGEDRTPHSEDDRIEADILNELREGEGDHTYLVYVSRVTGPSAKGYKEPHLFKGDAQTMLPDLYDRLKVYGNGVYRIRVHKDGAFWRKFDIAIELPPEPKERPVSDLSGMAAFTQTLRDMQNQQTELIRQLITEIKSPAQTILAPAPAIDPVSMFEKFSVIAANLRGPSHDMGGIFKEALSFAREVGAPNPEPERGSDILGIIEKLISSPLLGTILEAVKVNGQPQAQIADQRPAVPAVPHRPAPVPPPLPGNDMMAYVKQMLIFLADKARRKSEVEAYASMVIDSLPETLLPQFLAESGVYEQLQTIEPAIVPYKDWFMRLLAEMRSIVHDELNGGEFDGTSVAANGAYFNTGREPGGNQGHAENHEADNSGVQERPSY